MEITLEKIELVKDRTGISYKEAKEALEEADGSVVDAIIQIEESIDNKERMNPKESGAAILDVVKQQIKKGNVSKIVVRNSDEEVILNIPVNAGIVGALVAPWGLIAGAIAVAGFKYVVEIIKADGTIIDISERTSEFTDKAMEKGEEFKEAAMEKASDAYDAVKDKAEGGLQQFKDKADMDSIKVTIRETAENVKDTVKDKIKKGEAVVEDDDDSLDD